VKPASRTIPVDHDVVHVSAALAQDRLAVAAAGSEPVSVTPPITIPARSLQPLNARICNGGEGAHRLSLVDCQRSVDWNRLEPGSVDRDDEW
jgi:hypothetical protein